AFGRISGTSCGKGVSAVGIESNGLVAIGKRSLGVGSSPVAATPDGIALSVLRIELNGLVGSRDTLVDLIVIEFCAGLSYQGRVAHSRGFLTLALRLRLGLALRLRLRGS